MAWANNTAPPILGPGSVLPSKVAQDQQHQHPWERVGQGHQMGRKPQTHNSAGSGQIKVTQVSHVDGWWVSSGTVPWVSPTLSPLQILASQGQRSSTCRPSPEQVTKPTPAVPGQQPVLVQGQSLPLGLQQEGQLCAPQGEP